MTPPNSPFSHGMALSAGGQVKKAAQRFGCQRVTFVGDRGMVKSGQVEDLSAAGFHYITAITKPQIRALIKRNVRQPGLFDEKLCEVLDNGVRYILRRNPLRAEEMARTRAAKLAALQSLATKQNEYLAAHPRADVHKHWLLVAEKHGRLGLTVNFRLVEKARWPNREERQVAGTEITVLGPEGPCRFFWLRGR